MSEPYGRVQQRGYYGYVEAWKRWVLFPTEDEYRELLNELDNSSQEKHLL